ncbi:MAG TPA: hypothetical protein VMR70_07650 [Flavisolibacter sp.]|nr:hypothetical protein [Flavisolibacter sp.]
MKTRLLLLTLLIASQAFSQADKKLDVFLSFQANTTLYDRTASNNSGAAGLGVQTVLNTKTRVRPTVEINGNIFGGTKQLYLTTDGKPVDSKNGVLSIHAGPYLQLSNRFFAAATIGSHFYNDEIYFSARPSVGVYPTRNKKWTLKTAFTNVFQRDEISNENFGYLSFAIALRF